jgi:uncharacterized glyoxalase superfamily protein PhnB
MTVRRLFPIVVSRDLPRLVAFYEAALGAAVTYRFTTDGVDDYVSLALGDASLGIGRDPDVEPAPAAHDRAALWFSVDDVDAAFQAWVDAGGRPEQPPADMPWGERVAQVRDPDGTLVDLGAEATGG